MKRILLILAISTPLFLTACKQNEETTSPQTSSTTSVTKSELFEFVPADTPYLFASLEGYPTDVIEAYLNDALPLYTKLRDDIATLAQHSKLSKASTPTNDAGADADAGAGADADSDTVTVTDKDLNSDSENNFLNDTSFAHLAFGNSILSDFIDNPGIEGLEKIGFSADAKAVIYGLGLFPVVRMEIGDEARLRATLEKAFTEAGGIPEEKTLNGRKYWQAGNKQFQLITSIHANELVISLIPTSLTAEALPNILAQSKPENQLDLIKSLTTLNQNNDYTNYGSGWLDTIKVLGLFLNNDSSAAVAMRHMIDFDAQSVTQACRDDYNAIAANFPRMHAGSHSLTVKEYKSSFTIELQQSLANDLKSLVIADALSTTASEGLLNFGFALNIAKAREWLLKIAGNRVENPYKCEKLESLNQSYVQAYEGLNRPLPPFVGNFIGFKLFIDELDLEQMATGNPMPQKIKAMFSMLTSNPEMLVGMGQMFMPELAGLDLSPGADPVELTLDGIAKPDEPLWAASSKTAIGVAVGEGMHTELLGFLDDGGSKNGEFFSLGMDTKLLLDMQAAGSTFMQEHNPSLTTHHFISTPFDRLYFSASFTSKGVVFKHDQVKK